MVFRCSLLSPRGPEEKIKNVEPNHAEGGQAAGSNSSEWVLNFVLW
jgi:hypothetical protein